MRHLGRYAMFGEIASGGMASVHFGRLLGPSGFARTVVIKRMLRELIKDPEFAAMFVDEACLAARVKHPNVVSTLDVVSDEDELFIVMDYIHGESLEALMVESSARGQSIPQAIVSAIMVQALLGLHAAHEAVSAEGEPLHLVHRDFSPHNVLVDVDGIARVADFGVAKTAQKLHRTRDGQIKGKWSYMSPEQIAGEELDRRSDVFAAGIVLWEALTLERLFLHQNPARIATDITFKEVAPPSAHGAASNEALDAVVLTALAKEPGERFATARAMAEALRRASPPADTLEVSSWLQAIAGEALEERARRVAAVERASASISAVKSAAISHVDSGAPDTAIEQDAPGGVRGSVQADVEPGALSTLAAGSRLVDQIEPILAVARAERVRFTPPPPEDDLPGDEAPPTKRQHTPSAPPSNPVASGKATLARDLAASTLFADDAPDPIALARELAVSSRPAAEEPLTRSDPVAVAPPPKRRWLWGAALLVAGGAIAYFFFTQPGDGRTTTRDGAAATSGSGITPPVMPPLGSTTPSASEAPPSSAAPSPPAPSASSTPASRPAVEAPSARVQPSARPPKSAGPNCNPDYILRPDGVKVFKPECFER
jgi:serine/threonine-protein kinase